MNKKKIVLALVPLIAGALMSCGPDVDDPANQITRSCVDPTGQVQPPDTCQNMYDHNGQVYGHVNWYYYWYYNRGIPFHPVVGSYARGGVVIAPRGATFDPGQVHVTSISRGGFGESAGHGIGAGE